MKMKINQNKKIKKIIMVNMIQFTTMKKKNMMRNKKKILMKVFTIMNTKKNKK